MTTYLHRVMGFYATRTDALAARDQLVEHGLPITRLNILEPGTSGSTPDRQADSDDVLHELLRDGAIGVAVGTAAGAAGAIGLAAAGLTLFVASPVLGALYLLGWGASLGGFAGTLVGGQGKKGEVSDLVNDALSSGHVVLVAHATSEEQTTTAQRVIAESVGESPAPSPTDATPVEPAGA